MLNVAMLCGGSHPLSGVCDDSGRSMKMESPNPTRQRTPHGPRPRVSSSFPAPSPAVQSSFFRRPSDGPWTPLVAIAPSGELGTDRFPLTGTVSSKEWCRDWTLRRIIAAGVARWSGIMNPIDLYTTFNTRRRWVFVVSRG